MPLEVCTGHFFKANTPDWTIYIDDNNKKYMIGTHFIV